jgi:hypothetical protein
LVFCLKAEITELAQVEFGLVHIRLFWDVFLLQTEEFFSSGFLEAGKGMFNAVDDFDKIFYITTNLPCSIHSSMFTMVS